MAPLTLQDRTTEAIVGVLMALTFRGAAHAVAEHPTALVLVGVSVGGTFAWALVDAVLMLMQAKGSRLRFARLVAGAQARQAPPTEFEGLARHLDARGKEHVAAALRDAARALPAAPTRLSRSDWQSAGAVVAAVLAAGVPPLVPFLLVPDPEAAFHASNAVAGLVLFVVGAAWGKGHGLSAWRAGLALTALGAVLVGTLFLLGG